MKILNFAQNRQSLFRMAAPVLLAAMGLGAVGNAEAAVILQFQMGQAQPQIEDAANTGDGGNLTGNTGYSTFLVTSTEAYPTQPVLRVNPNGADANAASAYTNSRFFSFTLTVGSNVQDLDLTSLTFNAARGGNGTPRGFGVRVDTPTTSDELVRDSTTIDTVRTTFQNYVTSLDGIASLQNLTAGQVVTFEIATYVPSANVSIEFDDITVNGNVTLVPEPGSAFMLVGAAGLLLRRARRSKSSAV